ncbi:hypothetical protein G6F31_020648 [Rhizopus arrhizus]|nr:hypothetical protein G6F31_020648 [Rhizopus arrhizus]KAG0920753.1 hypothetical protein G6F32_015443 [Rhizopus arrhizus]
MMSAEGSLRAGFRALMALSSHFLILPRKMSASTGPDSFSLPGSTPSTLTTDTVPPITAGNCSRPFFSRSAAFMGSSEAPKSTVLAMICCWPPPEPIDW